MVEPVTEWERVSGQRERDECHCEVCMVKIRAIDAFSGVAALRAELADLRNEVEILNSRIAYLESKGRR